MGYFDSGANLADERFAADLDSVLGRAGAAGLKRLVVTGYDLDSSRRALELHRAHPDLLAATAGVHPHAAGQFDCKTQAAQLRELVQHPDVCAVGETGLDYHRNLSPRKSQLKCLQFQLDLAAKIGKPVFLHQRDAHGDLFALLREFRPQLTAALIHCFTGDADELEDWLGLDMYIGITGWICDERRGLHLRNLVGRIPPDRLLLETDAPYLCPRDLPPQIRKLLASRGRNEPLTLPHIAETVASCCGEDTEKLVGRVWQNSLRFFGLPG